MSRNEVVIDARRERVFSVVAERTEEWVVGGRVGSRIAATRVLESEPPRRLVLRARLRPLGALRVIVELENDAGGGTRVVLHESPDDGALALLRNPLSDALLAGRNALSLRRLKELAEA